MRVPLWCRIFGHKFYYVDFHPTHYKRHVGVTYDFETLEGCYTQRDVTFCTRCGKERAKIMEETRTIAQQPHDVMNKLITSFLESWRKVWKVECCDTAIEELAEYIYGREISASKSKESTKLSGVDLVVNQQCIVREKDSITPEEYGFCPHCIGRFSFRKLDKTFLCPWCHKDVRISPRMA